jgi:hypothetical protein
MARLHLPTVTLAAATSVNVAATIAAMRACMEQVEFADCILLTDVDTPDLPTEIRVVPMDPLRSVMDYSRFMLTKLVEHIATPHVLVCQWDGFIVDASAWNPRFLDYDYVGAPWPQFADNYNVGNGGFSLRSRRLLEAMRDPAMIIGCPEDVVICRTNRALLEERHSIRFADVLTAADFAYERSRLTSQTFGFHGAFNMIPIMGADAFWRIYLSLDQRESLFTDYDLIFRQLGRSPSAWKRQLRLTVDRALSFFQ